MKLLVCVDLSPAATVVLEHASRLGAATGSELVVMHAAAPEPTFVGYDEPGRGPRPVDERADELGRERALMTSWVEDLRRRELAVADPVLRIGPTVETILAVADEIDADLVVIARRSHGLLHQLVLGSTADSLVRHAARPVLLVPLGDRS